MDVIIFSGQSNMQGQTECLTESLAVSDAYEYKWLTDEAVPLRNPVGENITYALTEGEPVTYRTDIPAWLKTHALGASCYGNTNLVPAFCRTYGEGTGRSVLAVHGAKGSTVIADWLPGTPIYDVLVRKVRGALAKVDPDRIFFVWLQGESDALCSVTREKYKASLRTLCGGVKADLGIDRFGIIRVGRFAKDGRDDEIIGAQEEICEEDPDFIMLTRLATELNEKPEFMNPSVGGHYSAAGLELLGAEAAKTLCQLL